MEDKNIDNTKIDTLENNTLENKDTNTLENKDTNNLEDTLKLARLSALQKNFSLSLDYYSNYLEQSNDSNNLKDSIDLYFVYVEYSQVLLKNFALQYTKHVSKSVGMGKLLNFPDPNNLQNDLENNLDLQNNNNLQNDLQNNNLDLEDNNIDLENNLDLEDNNDSEDNYNMEDLEDDLETAWNLLQISKKKFISEIKEIYKTKTKEDINMDTLKKLINNIYECYNLSAEIQLLDNKYKETQIEYYGCMKIIEFVLINSNFNSKLNLDISEIEEINLNCIELEELKILYNKIKNVENNTKDLKNFIFLDGLENKYLELIDNISLCYECLNNSKVIEFYNYLIEIYTDKSKKDTENNNSEDISKFEDDILLYKDKIEMFYKKREMLEKKEAFKKSTKNRDSESDSDSEEYVDISKQVKFMK